MAAPVTNFLEIVLPEELFEGIVGGPAYVTMVDEAQETGAEERVSLRENGRGEWTLTGGVYDLGRTETLINFFRVVKGRRFGFRMKDLFDYQISNPTDMVQVGTSLSYQIVKRYPTGGREEVRNIYKPIAATVQVYNNATPVTGWTLDATKGLVTFSAIPGFLPRVSGEFHVPVRFGIDRMRMQYLSVTQRSWPDIPLVELMDDEATP